MDVFCRIMKRKFFSTKNKKQITIKGITILLHSIFIQKEEGEVVHLEDKKK